MNVLHSTDYDKDCNYNEEFDDSSQIIISIPNEYAGKRLDAALALLIPEYSRTRIANAIKDGHASLNNGQVLSAKTKLVGGEQIIFRLPEIFDETAAFEPEEIPLSIVYEDDDVIVIDKPANLVVHPAAGNWSGTLLNGLLFYSPQLSNVPRAGIVHRLDKDTSGLMVVAKNIAAQTHLVRQLQARTVKRIYRAIADGIVPYDGKIETQIGRNPHNSLKMAVVPFGGKLAITHVTVLERFENHSYIECMLETGRTHQIRVHMKEAKHPLTGDLLYGNPRHSCSDEIKAAVKNMARQALHAHKLSFIHPTREELVEFTSPLPSDIHNLLKILRGETNIECTPIDIDDDDFDEDDDDSDVEIIYVRE